MMRRFFQGFFFGGALFLFTIGLIFLTRAQKERLKLVLEGVKKEIGNAVRKKKAPLRIVTSDPRVAQKWAERESQA